MAVTPTPAPIVVTEPPPRLYTTNSSLHRTHTFCDQHTGYMPLSRAPPTPYLSRITPSAPYLAKLIAPNIFYCVDHVLQKPNIDFCHKITCGKSRCQSSDLWPFSTLSLQAATMSTTDPKPVLPLEQIDSTFSVSCCKIASAQCFLKPFRESEVVSYSFTRLLTKLQHIFAHFYCQSWRAQNHSSCLWQCRQWVGVANAGLVVEMGKGDVPKCRQAVC